MTKNNSLYISGLNNGSPVAINDFDNAPLGSIMDTITVSATGDRLPSYEKQKEAIISRSSKRPRQKKTEKNDPNYDMVSLSKKRNTKRQPSESLEEQDLTLNRSNAATCTENVIKKRRGRPPKALNVLNI